MQIKSKLLAIAMLLGVVLMAPAQADVFNTTPLDMYPTVLPGTQSSFISNVIATPSTPFDDLWTFDISQAGATASASAIALATDLDGNPFPMPLGLQLRLLAWNGTEYNKVLFDSGVTSAPFIGPLELDPSTGGAAGHGFYAVQVLGNTPPGSLVSQYSGQLQVSAVPEPSMYLLLAGGLLLFAWRARNISL